MTANRVKVGIVGLGRWAKVLTRAALASDALQIVAGYSRSEEKRAAFAQGIRHRRRARSRRPCSPIPTSRASSSRCRTSSTCRSRARSRRPASTSTPRSRSPARSRKASRSRRWRRRYGVTVTVGHSARLMAGIRLIREAIDAGELGRVGFIEANFSNERALELTPKMWRWYKDRAPGGPLSQLAIHHFDVLHYLGGEIVEASSMASKLSPVGAEVDDQSMTLLRFADGKIGYVGASLDLAGHFRRARVRLEGADALRDRLRHLGHARPSCTRPRRSTSSAARTATPSARRSTIPESDMFRAELEMFAESCRSGKAERALGAQRQCRGRGGLRRAALDRAARPGGAHRRRDRGGARRRRREEPPCCLAAISST